MTDPDSVPEAAPAKLLGGGQINEAKMLADLMGQAGLEVPKDLAEIAGGDGGGQIAGTDMQAVIDKAALSSILQGMFALWAQGSGDVRKLLSQTEADNYGEAWRMVLEKHWPGFVGTYAVELNLLGQTIAIFQTRIGNGRGKPADRETRGPGSEASGPGPVAIEVEDGFEVQVDGHPTDATVTSSIPG